LLVFGLASGCSRDDAASPTAPSIDSTTLVPATPAPTAPPVVAPAATAVVETPTPAAVVVGVVATAAPTAPLVAPDGPTLLQQAFDLAVPGYHFVTTATVNGVAALTAEGDHIGGGTRLTVVSQNVTSGYVILPEGTWVLDGGVWKETEDPPPVTDPISALRAPSTVAVAAFTATGATLIASYPAAALALEGDVPVDITFEIEGTALRSITYLAPSVVPASVRADISALVDTSPVVAPTA
jgi:hypothetical protein